MRLIKAAVEGLNRRFEPTGFSSLRFEGDAVSLQRQPLGADASRSMAKPKRSPAGSARLEFAVPTEKFAVPAKEFAVPIP